MSDATEYVVRRTDGMFLGLIELTPEEFAIYRDRADSYGVVALRDLPAQEWLVLQPVHDNTEPGERVYLDAEGIGVV